MQIYEIVCLPAKLVARETERMLCKLLSFGTVTTMGREQNDGRVEKENSKIDMRVPHTDCFCFFALSAEAQTPFLCACSLTYLLSHCSVERFPFEVLKID